ILGTAAYMSPEQAKGKEVDRRADLWAFGIVLYAMLTGKMAFSGETISETMAAVMMKEPDWDALPKNTPSRLQELLRRCLVKEQRGRLQAIGEARIAVEKIIAHPEIETPAGVITSERVALRRVQRQRTVLFIGCAVLLIAAIIQSVVLWRPKQPPPAMERTRFTLATSSDVRFPSGF